MWGIYVKIFVMRVTFPLSTKTQKGSEGVNCNFAIYFRGGSKCFGKI